MYLYTDQEGDADKFSAWMTNTVGEAGHELIILTHIL